FLEKGGLDFNQYQCIYIDGSLGIDLDLPVAVEQDGLRLKDPVFKVSGGITGYYKPDLGKKITLEATATGTASAEFELLPPDFVGWELVVVASVKAEAKLRFWPDPSFEKEWVLLKLPDQQASASPLLAAPSTLSTLSAPGENWIAMPVAESAIVGDPLPVRKAGDERFVGGGGDLAGFRAMDEGAQEATAEGAPSAAAPAAPGGGAAPAQANLTLVENVFAETEQALAGQGSELMLLYVRDTAADPEVHELAWTRYDGANWSAPLLLPGAVSAHVSMPEVAYDGTGDAVAIWQQLRTTPAPGATLAEIVGDLELAWAKWDAGTGSWGAPQFLSSNTLYDGDPALCGPLADGDLLLTWRETAANDNFPTGGVLKSRRWDTATGAWEAEVVAEPSFAGAGEFACGGDAGKVVIAWSSDQDGDYTDATDTEIFYRIWQAGAWGSQVRHTNDVASDRNVRTGVNSSGNIFLAWHRDGDLVFAQDFAAPDTVLVDADILGMSAFRLTVGPAGNVLLIWQEPFETGSDARYAVYDPLSMSWSETAELFSNTDAERAFEPLWDASGNLTVSYLVERLVLTTQQYALEGGGTVTVDNVPESTGVDLAVTKRSLIKNLSLVAGDFTTSDTAMIPGNVVTLNAVIRNSGNVSIEGPMVRFYLGDPDAGGVAISNVFVGGWLAGNSEQTVSAPWTVPADASATAIYAVVDADNAVAEFDETDNRQSLIFGGTDLSVAFKSAMPYMNGSARVIARIFNGGAPASAATTVDVRREDGTWLASVPVATVAPGEIIEVAADLPAGTQRTVLEKYVLQLDAVAANDVDASNDASAFSIYYFPDEDGDGMSDIWELANGLDSANPDDWDDDDDLDGNNNLTEFLAGTDPQNSASRFMFGVEGAGWENGNEFVLRWNALVGHEYSIEVSPDMSPGSWTVIPGSTLVADSPDMEMGIVLLEVLQDMFFRVSDADPAVSP
ncbi:MAG: CARDB domain-containing protein, partial [Verrucomicrobiales bacterium]